MTKRTSKTDPTSMERALASYILDTVNWGNPYVRAYARDLYRIGDALEMDVLLYYGSAAKGGDGDQEYPFVPAIHGHVRLDATPSDDARFPPLTATITLTPSPTPDYPLWDGCPWSPTLQYQPDVRTLRLDQVDLPEWRLYILDEDITEATGLSLTAIEERVRLHGVNVYRAGSGHAILADDASRIFAAELAAAAAVTGRHPQPA